MTAKNLGVFRAVVLSLTLSVGGLAGADAPKPPLGPQAAHDISSVVGKFGYRFLDHRTRADNLLSIVQKGGLVTGEKLPPPTATWGNIGVNTPGKLFFSLRKNGQYPEEQNLPFENKPSGVGAALNSAQIIVDKEAMAKASFHIAKRGTPMGNVQNDSYRSIDSTKKLNAFLANIEAERSKPGEVVFHDDVPLKFIKRFVVSSEAREGVLASFRKAGIARINGTQIEQFVVTP